MLYRIGYTIVIILLVSCKNDNTESSSEKVEFSYNDPIKIKVSNQDPSFDEYLVEKTSCDIDSLTLDKIFFKNQDHFKAFYYERADLSDYCKIFAGHYIAIDMLQGSETVRTYIFDCTDGKMYESPLFMYSSEFRANSRLYIKDPNLDNRQRKECENSNFDCSKQFYVWNEEQHIFELIN